MCASLKTLGGRGEALAQESLVIEEKDSGGGGEVVVNGTFYADRRQSLRGSENSELRKCEYIKAVPGINGMESAWHRIVINILSKLQHRI